MKNTPWKRLAGIGLAVMLATTACSTEQAQTTSTAVTDSGDAPAAVETSTEPDQTEAPGEPEPEPTVPPIPTGSNDSLLVFDSHPNGIQAQLTAVDFAADGTTLDIRWISGREFDTRVFGYDDSMLTDANGTTYVAVDAAELELPEAEITESQLRFEQISADAGPYTLTINPDGDDERTLDEGAATYRIGPFDLTDVAPELPAGFGLNDSQTHEEGTTLQVLGFGFSDTAIGVNVTHANNHNNASRWSNGRNSSYLEDDLGNRYYMEIGPGEYRGETEEGETSSGTMVFSGRVDPAANSLLLVLNSDGNNRRGTPLFEMGPYPLTGEFEAAGVLEPIAINDTYVHPNSGEYTLNGLRFTEAGGFADMAIDNKYRGAIRLTLGRRTYLRDDLGNTYDILTPADNSNFQIDGDTGFTGEISFPGNIDSTARSIEVIFNDGQDAERDPVRSGFPEVRFGPYPLARGAATLGTPPDDFGPFTSFTGGQLEVSSGDFLGLIFDEFSGIEVPGGVLLTLPEGILFESGESRLGRDSRTAIGKITQILEFYEGDEVIVLGHTDSQGSDAFNQQLSEDRAASVVEALINDGNPSNLISGEGRGETDPVDSNDTDSGRSANRRVEIMVRTDKGLP